jgi:hypothetical protein
LVDWLGGCRDGVGGKRWRENWSVRVVGCQIAGEGVNREGGRGAGVAGSRPPRQMTHALATNLSMVCSGVSRHSFCWFGSAPISLIRGPTACACVCCPA